MALVVLLRGVNVGGSRTFKPTQLVAQLKHLDAVNIGAAGTLVIRKTVAIAALRAELEKRLPFVTEIMICQGRDILRLMSTEHYAKFPPRADETRFVSVLAKTPPKTLKVPMTLPPKGKWLMQILAREDRFVLGVYRRHMKVIGYLGTMDKLFGVPATTRNWNTITAIAKVLAG